MRSESDLGELLDALDIESWMDSQGVDYIRTRGRSGPQLNVRTCPVCGNDGRKVYINADTGLGSCFGGSHPPEQKFNKWSFVKASLGELSGGQVVDHIRNYVRSRGWAPKRMESKVEDAPVRLIMPESIPLPLPDGRSIKYLTNRGFGPDIARYFGLRYCHQGYFPYMNDGVMRTMDFSGRVLIPVHDLAGEMVTFQGRDITGQAERKYLFPPGLAATGTQLLNGQNVRDTKRVVVGEGAFDVAAIKVALDQRVHLRDVIPVGTFGKHLSWGPGDTQESKFVELKNRGVEEVTFMWDGELQATDDAIKAGLRLKALGMRVRIALLPAGKDPNEVSAEVVQRAFETSIPLTKLSAITIMFERRKSLKAA